MAAALSGEIAFFPVGNGSSGDAILVRYTPVPAGGLGAFQPQEEFGLIDGGSRDSGNSVADYLRNSWDVATLDWVVLSHPDQDHASGIVSVLEAEIDVRRIWMHTPWLVRPAVLQALIARADARSTVNRADRETAQAILAGFTAAEEVYRIARRRQIPTFAPTPGAAIGPFTVLSPSIAFYGQLLPSFDAATPRTVRTGRKITPPAGELLPFGQQTSARNESSTILLGSLGGQKVLLTADAGQHALTEAIVYARQQRLELNDLALLQVPHHGSRRNLSDEHLRYIRAAQAIVSAGEGDEAHPRARTVLALQRAGMPVQVTRGRQVHYFYNRQRPAHFVDVPGEPTPAAVED